MLGDGEVLSRHICTTCEGFYRCRAGIVPWFYFFLLSSVLALCLFSLSFSEVECVYRGHTCTATTQA